MSASLCIALLGCGKREEKDGNGAPETTPVVAPAPKPMAALAKGASCVTPECHASYTTARHIHGPVGAKSCESCHGPDEGGHRYPLLRHGNDLCTFCHSVSGTKTHQHKALAIEGTKGGCLSCHEPHTSRAKYLLTADTVGALCAKCHDTPLKKHAHEPFAEGNCTVCHQAHQSEYAKLLRTGSGPEHCYGCHAEKKQAFARQPFVHKASAKDCTTCHGPHATDFPRQLKASANNTCIGTCHKELAAQLAAAPHVHGAVDQGCSTCHDPHASGHRDQLRSRMDKVCMTCHDKPVTAKGGQKIASMTRVLASANLHGPVKSGSCSECHDPHSSKQRDLLRKDFPQTFYAAFDAENYALCFSCHDKKLVLSEKTPGVTNFRDGERNLHYVHVNRSEKGRTCKTCHDVHGSDLPKHMAASVPFEGSNWAMPIRYEPNENGGSCTPGCHQEQSYRRNKTAAGKSAEGGAR